MMIDVEKIREQFPVTRSKVFLNHSAYSPLPQPVVDVMRRYNDELSRFEVVEEDYTLGHEVFAELIGAGKEEVALVPNTSTSLNIAVSMLDCPLGANVVTTDLEYPSVVYPWLKRRREGLEVRYVKNLGGRVLLEDMVKAIDDKTVAVAISHVAYSNGFRHDLKALAEATREHGAYLIVDAIQSLGVIPVNVKKEEVDFMMASCYKWMLGPAGAGYLYVRKELVERLEPTFVGWASVKPGVFETVDFWDIWQLQLSDTASRFEVGAPSFVSYMGAVAAIKLLLEMGIEKIQERVLDLTDLLMEKVKDLGYQLTTPEDRECRSGIVHFHIDKAQEKADALKKKGIIVSARSNGLRVAPHFYNTEEEIDRLIKELRNA